MTTTAPDRHAVEPVTALARRLADDGVVDADDVIAALESLGVSDRTARERYGMPSVFTLGDAVLTHLRYGRTGVRPHRGVRRAPSDRAYLGAALLRCALYLGPLSAAVAATGPLHRVAWQVPTLTLLLGWSAAQALTGVGGSVAVQAGPAAAVRMVAGGFAAVAGFWCALVWVAPASLLGPDRLLAGAIGVGGLAALATVAAALVARNEAAVVRWSLPLWLTAALAVAGSGTDGWAARAPLGLLLPAAIAVALGRAWWPARSVPGPGRSALSAAELRRALCYLIIGAAQAVCVAMLWRTGPAGVTPPAVLPLLAAVPVLEALVGWHTSQIDAGLDSAESGPAFAEHLRGVTLVTVAGLLPPLAIGVALAAGAYRLPYGLAAYTDARDLVLALAGGTLLGGVLAATLLLAARGRTAVAAAVAATPPLFTALMPLVPAHLLAPIHTGGTSDLLPIIVAILAVTHLVGLLAVAYTALDHRRTS